MQYESSISYGKEVMAKVKVFVHATDADIDADADGRAVTLAPRKYLSRLAKKASVIHTKAAASNTRMDMHGIHQSMKDRVFSY